MRNGHSDLLPTAYLNALEDDLPSELQDARTVGGVVDSTEILAIVDVIVRRTEDDVVQKVETFRAEFETQRIVNRELSKDGPVQPPVGLCAERVSSRRSVCKGGRILVSSRIEILAGGPLGYLVGIAYQIESFVSESVAGISDIAAANRSENLAGMSNENVVDLPVPQNIIDDPIPCREPLPSAYWDLIEGIH
jgi:hypothetical protein